jgi:hypothetical protein
MTQNREDGRHTTHINTSIRIQAHGPSFIDRKQDTTYDTATLAMQIESARSKQIHWNFSAPSSQRFPLSHNVRNKYLCFKIAIQIWPLQASGIVFMAAFWYPFYGRILVSFLWPHSGIVFMVAFPNLYFIFLIITSQTFYWVPWPFFAHHYNRAIRYGLDGLGIESRWERKIPHPSRPALGHTQLPTRCKPGH